MSDAFTPVRPTSRYIGARPTYRELPADNNLTTWELVRDGRPSVDSWHPGDTDRLLERLRAVHGAPRADLVVATD
jgi:hypothetical protein